MHVVGALFPRRVDNSHCMVSLLVKVAVQRSCDSGAQQGQAQVAGACNQQDVHHTSSAMAHTCVCSGVVRERKHGSSRKARQRLI